MPPTFEALIVLSSFLWNAVCFTIAALAIHELTYAILLYSQKEICQESERKTVLSLANMTAVAFVLNPANVFFISCYSEATFSCMTFTGTALFMLASYTRSNGSLIAIFIFIHLSAKILTFIKDKKGLLNHFRCCLGYLLLYTPQMILIITPIYYHEKRGIAFHCVQDYRPAWCDILDQSTPNFSLYGYVQNKHWNVGLFRYWTLAQIPNFILASPILCLGSLGVTCWIKASVNKYKVDTRIVKISQLCLSSNGHSMLFNQFQSGMKGKKVTEA
ncbi:hypothetical protein CTEN210_01544 [Chaetoceros tenuissimus]|uniref:GPI mannosyltransferase 2 n=1 Tax=Chaetoceros tenuissimus TaxID=426638 RepID=A0AAD3CH64_9STRA|nr:hypothetical protein CTEN210_01544 [Chaetoceros tenuissimus]